MASDEILDATAQDLQLQQFCAQYAFGVPIPEALRSACYDTHRVDFGYSLLKSDRARELVDQHRKWMLEQLSSSVEQCKAQLDRDREFAYASGNPAAAVNATMNKAKLLGYLDISSKGGEMIAAIRFLRPDEVEGQ